MIKDTTYAISFDKKDLPYLYQYAKKVRETHNQDLVNQFNLICDKKWNDHNNVRLNGIEPLQVSKADDLVVSAGTTLLINQILGTSVTRWRHMAMGSGTTAVSAGQTALVTTAWGVDMSISGWREYAGATLRFAGIFGETISTTVVITEAGVFTGALGTGTMLNRNMFSNAPFTYQVDLTGVVISSIIDFVPIV